MFYAASVRNDTAVARALELRKEFALTAVRLVASRPFFGVGIGDYRIASGEFTSERLRAGYPNENAHNNFLQILAEVGSIGFAVFAVLRPCRHAGPIGSSPRSHRRSLPA